MAIKKDTITRAINLLENFVPAQDEEMKDLVQQLMSIVAKAGDADCTIRLVPVLTHPATGVASQGYQFRDDIVTVAPTSCLVEDIQKMRAALSKAKASDYNSVQNLIEEGYCTVECLETLIELYTEVPSDLQITPSGSSLVAMGVQGGIIVQNDGSDIVCRAGHPISRAMRAGCVQCESTCPHYKLCFANTSGDVACPDDETLRYGRIAPMEMELKAGTTDDDVVAYLEKALLGRGESKQPKLLSLEKLPEMCFSVLASTGELICIVRGESGYYQSDWNTPSPEKNREFAAVQNAELGVTEAQRKAMEMGSMFAWDVPVADPEYWEAEFAKKK